MRGERYCEVLLVKPGDGTITADVYNSYPLNTCPAAAVGGPRPGRPRRRARRRPRPAQRPPVLAHGRRREGRRGQRAPEGHLRRDRDVPPGVGRGRRRRRRLHPLRRPTPSTGARCSPSTPGSEVYELVAADGTVYVMQTWSQQKDPTLVEADLAGLAARLALPGGLELPGPHPRRAAAGRHHDRGRPGPAGRPRQQLLPGHRRRLTAPPAGAATLTSPTSNVLRHARRFKSSRARCRHLMRRIVKCGRWRVQDGYRTVGPRSRHVAPLRDPGGGGHGDPALDERTPGVHDAHPRPHRRRRLPHGLRRGP